MVWLLYIYIYIIPYRSWLGFFFGGVTIFFTIKLLFSFRLNHVFIINSVLLCRVFFKCFFISSCPPSSIDLSTCTDFFVLLMHFIIFLVVFVFKVHFFCLLFMSLFEVHTGQEIADLKADKNVETTHLSVLFSSQFCPQQLKY